MKTSQIVETFQNNQVRIIIIDNEPWFVVPDIATILEYADPSMMLKLVDEEDKQVVNPQKLDPVSQTETFNSNTFRISIVNESGIYACIFGSHKPQAKVFKKWVTSEVLPSIRKTGKYEVKSKETDPISIIDGLIEGLKLTKQLQEEVAMNKLQIQELNEFKQEIKDTQQEAIKQLKALPKSTIEAEPIGTKALVNRMIRDYAINKSLSFGYVYNWVYREFRDRYHIDLSVRGKNNKPKLSGMDYADRNELIDKVYATAQEILVI